VKASDIVNFRGSTMIECPEPLRSGADLIVSLAVHVEASAFKPAAKLDDGPRSVFDESSETNAEQSLRERKEALLKLFDCLNIKPIVGDGAFEGKRHAKGNLSKDELIALTQRDGTGGKKIRTEIVGDGEEVEVEADSGDLSEGELDLIYKRYILASLIQPGDSLIIPQGPSQRPKYGGDGTS